MKKHFRIEVCCRIVEVDGSRGRQSNREISIIPEHEDLTRTFLVSRYETKEAAQAALIGTAVGAAFGAVQRD